MSNSPRALPLPLLTLPSPLFASTSAAAVRLALRAAAGLNAAKSYTLKIDVEGVSGQQRLSAARFLRAQALCPTLTRPAWRNSARGPLGHSSYLRPTPNVASLPSGLRFYASPAVPPTSPRVPTTSKAEETVLECDMRVPNKTTSEPHHKPEQDAVEAVAEVALQAEEPKKVRVEIVLNEKDIEEKFCKGSGKGGQKVNKSKNCVRLHHLPTGIRIRCHETRSQFDNRRIARKMLISKLDDLINGELSKNAGIQRKKREEWLKKREAWLEMKAARQREREAMEQDEEGEAGEEELELEEGVEETMADGIIAAEKKNFSGTHSRGS